MEKVIGNCIRNYAYGTGRSTKTALHQLADVGCDAIESREIALCRVLDLKGAFDNTPHMKIRDILTLNGVGNTLAFGMGRVLKSR